MKQSLFLYCIFLLSFLLQSHDAYCVKGDFYNQKQRGWFWFEEEDITDEDDVVRIENTNPSTASALDELKTFQNQLEESKAAMIMRPSVENTRRYLKFQKEVFVRSDIVSKNWQEAMLIDPALNVARHIPISEQAVRIRESALRAEGEALLKKFSKKFKLLFFYKKSCQYCIEFGNVLEIFAIKYGFKVASITIDGGIIKKFPASYNQHLIEKLKVQSTPSLFAYSEELGIAAAITHQFLALDLLERSSIFVAEKLRNRL